MQFLVITGTRPQIIKMGLLIKKLRLKGHVVYHVDTGQHYDKELFDDIYSSLQFDKPDINLHVGSATHAVQTSSIMLEIEKILLKQHYDVVIVVGDTNSTLAGALVPAKMNIPVVHLEAGVRNNDLTIPEELNRIMVDSISDLLFAPTNIAMHNLVNENKSKSRLRMFGDTTVDTIMHAYELEINTNPKKSIIPPNNFYLATVHRPRNTDTKKALFDIFQLLNTLPDKVLIPVHPRTRQSMLRFGLKEEEFHNIQFLPSVDYITMFNLMRKCLAILTDSGGVQKEAYIFKKPCFTLFHSTPWIETQQHGANIICNMNNDMSKVNVLNQTLKFSSGKKLPSEVFSTNIFGNGNTVELIINCLEEEFGDKK